ncbi:hypothetical protein EMST110833_01955 [Empedobacter stercoris]
MNKRLKLIEEITQNLKIGQMQKMNGLSCISIIRKKLKNVYVLSKYTIYV